MSTIVVSSNCQTGGVAAALARFLPSATVVPAPLPHPDDAASVAAFRDRSLGSADAWVVADRPALIDRILSPDRPRPRRIVRIPVILFDAFHPDVVYVESARTGHLTSMHYNSAIVAWCFKHGVEARTAARLFNPGVFEALGYFDRWTASVDELGRRFNAVNLDFASFFLSAKRETPFMHSVNHPTSRCLTILARLAAGALGADEGATSSAPHIPDGLVDKAWPLYPEIAKSYGVHGEYAWVLEGRRIAGVQSFIDVMFERYAAEDFEPADITISSGEPKLDAVLPHFLGAAS
jgi:hypothetical protein